MPDKDSMNVAMWAVNFARPIEDMDEWAALVHHHVVQAHEQGADIFVLPEYCSEQWLHFAPAGLEIPDQPAWMAEHGEEALKRMRGLAAQYDGMTFVMGSIPVKSDAQGGYINSAYIFLPGGKEIRQDKNCLTPREKAADGWGIRPGEGQLNVFDVQGYRVAVQICLDIELPVLSTHLAAANVDLVIVPAMTKMLSGFSRVFSCAKARAVELLAGVCAVGGIANSPAKGRLPNTGGAAAFVPCEEDFGYDGIFAHVGPMEETEGDGPLLMVENLPLMAIRQKRENQSAEVWPGAWKGEHVRVVDV